MAGFRSWLLFALVYAEPEADVEADCAGEEVCLFQSGAFMRRLSAEGHSSGECPGGPIMAKSDPGKCSYTGATVEFDGKAIRDLFDDNVQMREIKFKIAGDVYITPETHPFPVGPATKVNVETCDIAGNERMCHRTVTVMDEEKPDWVKPAAGVAEKFESKLDGECKKSAAKIFSEYESVVGFSPEGKDNCGIDGVTKQIRIGDTVLYDDQSEGSDVLTGVQTAELVYTLTDVNGNTRHHVAEVDLLDDEPPTVMEGCPDDIFVEVEANETTGPADWTLPKVTKDNCLEEGNLPLPKEVNDIGVPMVSTSEDGTEITKEHAVMAVGDHPVAYPLKDASGNGLAEECRFVITVKPKAHPVEVTCPPTVVTRTLPGAEFGLPTWAAPVVKQGEKVLDSATHVTYVHNVAPGMPFPYGETTVTVKATGEVTGDRTREEEQADECTFTVVVKDPERPYVDGRMFRCGEGAEPSLAVPFGVCKGPDLEVTLHSGYEDTGGYDLAGTVQKDVGCCADEHGAAYECVAATAEGVTTDVHMCMPAATTE